MDEFGRGGINFKIIFIGVLIVFIAVFALIYILDNLYKIKNLCNKDSSMNVCKINTFHIIILMLLLIAGGMIIVVSITAYILIKAPEEV